MCILLVSQQMPASAVYPRWTQESVPLPVCLLVDHVLHDDVTLELHAQADQAVHCHGHGRKTAFHVGTAATIETTIDNLAAQRILCPAIKRFQRNGVHVPVEHQGPASLAPFEDGDHVWPVLI